MPSLSGNRNEASKPRRPPAKKPASRGRRATAKSKKGSKQAADSPEAPALELVQEHFLKLLREEAKALNDPFLLYLYDMVIYRIKVGDPEA
jgi:hypothetical protein